MDTSSLNETASGNSHTAPSIGTNRNLNDSQEPNQRSTGNEARPRDSVGAEAKSFSSKQEGASSEGVREQTRESEGTNNEENIRAQSMADSGLVRGAQEPGPSPPGTQDRPNTASTSSAQPTEETQVEQSSKRELETSPPGGPPPVQHSRPAEIESERQPEPTPTVAESSKPESTSKIEYPTSKQGEPRKITQSNKSKRPQNEGPTHRDAPNPEAATGLTLDDVYKKSQQSNLETKLPMQTSSQSGQASMQPTSNAASLFGFNSGSIFSVAPQPGLSSNQSNMLSATFNSVMQGAPETKPPMQTSFQFGQASMQPTSNSLFGFNFGSMFSVASQPGLFSNQSNCSGQQVTTKFNVSQSQPNTRVAFTPFSTATTSITSATATRECATTGSLISAVAEITQRASVGVPPKVLECAVCHKVAVDPVCCLNCECLLCESHTKQNKPGKSKFSVLRVITHE